MASLSKALKRLTWLYTYVLNAGFTPLGHRLRERAADNNLSLRFSFGKIWVRSGDTEVAIAARHALQLWSDMPRWAGLINRIELTRTGNVRRGELAMPGRYRVPGCDDFVWLPVLPEAEDFLHGYFLHGEPKPGDVVFDCGAFCGEVTIALARKVGSGGRVISFEPDPSNLKWLRRNIAATGLQNITVIERGLWSETTRLRFSSQGGLGSRLLMPDEADEPGMIEVPVVGFAEACRLAGAVPSFVKMDIEGAEVEAIAGAREFIRGHNIRFAIASYHERDGVMTSALLEPLFGELGYEAETGHASHRTTWAWRKR